MSYAEFSGRPSYIRAVGDNGKAHDEQQWKWSGDGELPNINAKVTCSLGEAIVEKYFVEHGWVGVMVRPLNPPAWWVEQQKARMRSKPKTSPLAHFFGAEIKEVANEQG